MCTKKKKAWRLHSLVDDSAVREELRVIFTLQKSLENFSKTLFLAHKQKERGPFKIFFQEWKLGLDCRKLLKLHILECLVSGLEGLSHSRPWNSTNFVICYMKRGLRCRQKSKRSLKLINSNHDFLRPKEDHASSLVMRWYYCIWSQIFMNIHNLLQLINMNKRSAMLLDRLMYNLKEIMRKIPKDQIENGGQSGDVLDVASDSRVNCIKLFQSLFIIDSEHCNWIGWSCAIYK